MLCCSPEATVVAADRQPWRWFERTSRWSIHRTPREGCSFVSLRLPERWQLPGGCPRRRKNRCCTSNSCGVSPCDVTPSKSVNPLCRGGRGQGEMGRLELRTCQHKGVGPSRTGVVVVCGRLAEMAPMNGNDEKCSSRCESCACDNRSGSVEPQGWDFRRHQPYTCDQDEQKPDFGELHSGCRSDCEQCSSLSEPWARDREQGREDSARGRARSASGLEEWSPIIDTQLVRLKNEPT